MAQINWFLCKQTTCCSIAAIETKIACVGRYIYHVKNLVCKGGGREESVEGS